MLDTIVTFQNGVKQTLGMLDIIVTFQNGVKQTLGMLDIIRELKQQRF